jgi:biopolymer transport protein TolQ
MTFSLFNSAAWQLVRQMDWVALLILLGLFCASTICLAIIAFKYLLFKKHHQSLNALTKRMKHLQTFNELIATVKEFKDSLGGRFLHANMQDLRMLVQQQTQASPLQESPEIPTKVHLKAEEIQMLELSINQNLDALLLEEESYLPVLSASATTAPLVGLFGTIWGLIHAFIDISQEKSADIATVAPGMAEALIVTLAGLIVAIPAMIAHYYFSHELRKFEFQLAAIGDKFMYCVKQNFK